MMSEVNYYTDALGNEYLERPDGNFMVRRGMEWCSCPAANRGEIDLKPLSKTAHSATNSAHLPVTPEEDAAWDERRIDTLGQNGNDGLHYDAPLLSDEECDALKTNTKDDARSKYHVEIKQGVWIDVYDVLRAFNVTNPALQHLIKKALKPGDRGHKDKITDMQEIIDSAVRAKELEQ